MEGKWMEMDKKELLEGTEIFNPQAKVVANLDAALEFFKTGNTSPVLVEIDPSNACNHGCSFCLSSHIHFSKYKHLPTFNRSSIDKTALLELCEDLIDMDVKAINWTGGGEPTLHPNLGDAIKLIGERSSIKMGMFTNGTLLDKNNLMELIPEYLTWIRFSIDSGSADTYNTVRKTPINRGWDKVIDNLKGLVKVKQEKRSSLTIGVGFVISPENFHEITEFAKVFAHIGIDYCQYKPEIVNREREKGEQRAVEFWEQSVESRLLEAKSLLGKKFQVNGYKLLDLRNDPQSYGRNYKKCLGSQIQPCVGADGSVYVCSNHRGYKQYSYGSIYEKRFTEIWQDLKVRNAVMYQINDVEKFCNCTKLCKPHESNKMMWHIHENRNNKEEIDRLKRLQSRLASTLEHPEFI